jgi:hypothetical protein
MQLYSNAVFTEFVNLINMQREFEHTRTKSTAKWPRKKHNRTVGIRRDVKTGEKTGKVN